MKKFLLLFIPIFSLVAQSVIGLVFVKGKVIFKKRNRFFNEK